MIPQQLTLKNFLSYHEATLDFRGLHTACICGPNGAGKSSLLEAITWVLWGQTRAASDEDAINSAASEARVDFIFQTDGQTYRVIRSRRRGGNSTLELQVQTGQGKFRSLTGKAVRATQQEIIALLKLDYDTFINSAYLRQGRADEFMMRRPSERKQILADLLKLDRYEQLGDRAKDLSRQFKGQAEQLVRGLEQMEEQLAQIEAIATQRQAVRERLETLSQTQERERVQLQQLRELAQQRQALQQHLDWQQQQYQSLVRDGDRLRQDRETFAKELAQLQQFVAREAEIEAQYQRYLSLQKQEETFAAKFQAFQKAREKLTQLRQQQSEQINELDLQKRTHSSQLESLQGQLQETREILASSEEVREALVQLQAHREQLQKLDELQHHVAPLLQRRQVICAEIDRASARLNARLEQLQATESQLNEQMEAVPQVKSQVLQVERELKELEKKQVYRQRVEEKGQERKNFQQRLQENQRLYERQMGELSQKLELLKTPGAACPVCDRALDNNLLEHVVGKTQKEYQEIEQQFWVLREQMTACERELQLLRAEYRQLADELKPYDQLLQRRGKLSAKLDNTDEIKSRMAEIAAEKAKLERSLSIGNYAMELHEELQALDGELQRLNYDEKTHAIARGEEKRWRWAEIKQAKIDDAKRRQTQLAAKEPQLQAKIAELEAAILKLQQDSPLQKQIVALEQQVEQIGYDPQQHRSLSQERQKAQSWELKYQQIEQSKQQLPRQRERLAQLDESCRVKESEKKLCESQLKELTEQIGQTTDYRDAIQKLEWQIQQRRQKLDEAIAQQGKLEQTLAQLETLQKQYEDSKTRLDKLKRQQNIYQELAQAFGKNGIQALMIENVLPQLEAQTNHILSRLTGNQLHVQFITQKAGKGRSKKKAAKLIDTLDIHINDARGTRSYETYSGGEGFRINFAIRLALAKLLAQRSGTSLQMLIVDEGFGTQDSEGCDRLIAAINAISSDFACILAVTHMPQFKEAFQHRIEVRKTEKGSILAIAS